MKGAASAKYTTCLASKRTACRSKWSKTARSFKQLRSKGLSAQAIIESTPSSHPGRGVFFIPIGRRIKRPDWWGWNKVKPGEPCLSGQLHPNGIQAFLAPLYFIRDLIVFPQVLVEEASD